MTEEVAIRISAALLGMGIFLRSLGLLSLFSEFRVGEVLEQRSSFLGIRWFLVVRACLALPLVQGWLSPFLFALLFVVELSHHRAFRPMAMAWFTMELVVLAGLGLALVDPAEADLTKVCLSFIASVSVLAYFKNGVAKIRLESWRKGAFLIELFQSSRFRIPVVGRFLERRQRWSRAISWFVILFELAFPLAIIGGETITTIILSLGLVFHLGVAIVLRLQGFFWVFVATYPAIWMAGYWFSNLNFY